MGRGGKRPGSGRPPGRNPHYDSRLNIRVEKEQLDRWANAADLAGAADRTDWIRKTLDRECELLNDLYDEEVR